MRPTARLGARADVYIQTNAPQKTYEVLTMPRNVSRTHLVHSTVPYMHLAELGHRGPAPSRAHRARHQVMARLVAAQAAHRGIVAVHACCAARLVVHILAARCAYCGRKVCRLRSATGRSRCGRRLLAAAAWRACCGGTTEAQRTARAAVAAALARARGPHAELAADIPNARPTLLRHTCSCRWPSFTIVIHFVEVTLARATIVFEY